MVYQGINDKDKIVEASEELFIDYYEQNIVPLAEENNRIKDMFRSRFWAYLWGALFLYGLCVLIVLFRYLIYGYKIDGEYIFFISILACCSIFWPLYCYNKASKNDLFMETLRFYRNLHINEDTEINKAAVVPQYDNYKVLVSLSGHYNDNDIYAHEVVFTKDVKFYKWQFQRKISKGILIDFKFKQKIKNVAYLFEKNGFYNKNKYSDFVNISKDILIPAANYFRIFSDDIEFAKNFMPSVFFEQILDTKYIFGAKSVYIEIKDDYMRIYLEGARLYFCYNNLWSKFVNQQEFINLNKKISQILLFMHIVDTLRNIK